MSEVYETIGYVVLGFLSVMWLTKIAKCSLRDYFAAKALQGMLSEPSLRAKPEEFASKSYELADAMLSAREKS
jgi:hypothetical protein